MLVLFPVDYDTVPKTLDEVYPDPGDLRPGFQEMIHELEPELLDFAVEMVFCESVDRVTHGVRCEQVRVVAFHVGRIEVALQGDVRPDFGQVVAVAVPIDFHHPYVRLAVVVLTEDDLRRGLRARIRHLFSPSTTISLNLYCAILFISSRALSTSSSPEFFSRASAFSSIDSLVCSLTAKIIGISNFSL